RSLRTGQQTGSSPRRLAKQAGSASARRRRSSYVRVMLHCRTDASAACHTESLVNQALLKYREEQQHVGFLAAVAHLTHEPDFPFNRTEASGDFNIEFIEQLIAQL